MSNISIPIHSPFEGDSLVSHPLNPLLISFCLQHPTNKTVYLDVVCLGPSIAWLALLNLIKVLEVLISVLQMFSHSSLFSHGFNTKCGESIA